MLILLTESAEKNGAKNYINTKNDRGEDFLVPYLGLSSADPGLVEYFQKKGADLHAKNQEGQNMLHSIVEDHNPEGNRNLKKSFKYLLKNGINPYTPDQSGKSAYDKAKETGKADLIELFEKYNPDNKENRQKNINSQTANLPPLSDKTPRKANKRSSADDNTLLEKKRHHFG